MTSSYPRQRNNAWVCFCSCCEKMKASSPRPFSGVFNSLCWILFWIVQGQRYAWKGVMTIVITNCLLALELGDFAPIWWTFDAHSLWHAGTALLPILYYRYDMVDFIHCFIKKHSMALP